MHTRILAPTVYMPSGKMQEAIATCGATVSAERFQECIAGSIPSPRRSGTARSSGSVPRAMSRRDEEAA